MVDTHQKYDFLLHPIKDLTKNWQIDIANVLEDYLTELDKMMFSFDNGKTTVNFAEASFMIQGTACVWSRKVDHLHSLVHQTLEMIKNNKRGGQDDTEVESSNEPRNYTDQDDKFLNLNNLTLAPKPLTQTEEATLLPMGLTLLGGPDMDNRGTPFINARGEIFNYYNDFWSNQATPMLDGCVLLEQPYLQTNQIHHTAPSGDHIVLNDVTMEDDGCHSDNDDVHHFDNVPDDVTVEQQSNNDVIEETVEIRQLRQRQRQTTNVVEAETVEENSPDPPPMLDPHSVCAESLWQPKPFKKGNTSRLPPSVQNTNKRKRGGCRADNDIMLLSDFIDDINTKIWGKTSKAEEIERKRRFGIWKTLRRDHPPKKDQNRRIEFNEPVDNEVFVPEDNADDDNDYDVIDDHSLPIDDLIMDVEQNKENAPPVQNDAIQSCIDSIESYEDLVRHHVEKFYTSAKLHRHETDLSQRVLEWEDSITPFLEAENGHPEFDIHQNGDDVMRKFDRVGQEMMFLDVVQGESPWSVCRRFSATLQLANDSNFHLHTNPDFNSTVNSLQLKLLSKQKSRERLDDYLPL